MWRTEGGVSYVTDHRMQVNAQGASQEDCDLIGVRAGHTEVRGEASRLPIREMTAMSIGARHDVDW